MGLSRAQIWLGGGGGGGFVFVFADAVAVWRACVLWPGNKTVKVVLLTLLLTSLGSSVVSATLDTISSIGSGVVSTSSATGVMISLGLSLSLATNLVATILFGYKAYYHRLMMKATMGTQNSRSSAILLFLTESGVAFCILQAIALATNTAVNEPDTSLDYAAGMWQQITNFAAVAYPVLVLIIVDSHRSISDSTGGSAGDSGVAQGPNGIGSHISFAARPPGTSSSGGGIGEDSVIGSRVDPTLSADQSDEKSARFCDLEKAEGIAIVNR